jgi:putative restriction endonuclease
VLAAYNHRCALCGIRMGMPNGHTAVDATHIVLWCVSQADDPRLCHRPFDEGLLGVSGAYQVLPSWLRAGPNVPGRLVAPGGRCIPGLDPG